MKLLKKAEGFSLIELAIVCFISGIFLVAALQYYTLYYAQKQRKTTNENLALTQAALEEFYGLTGRYPCPADPTAAPGSANYGVEQCRANIALPCPVTATNVKCTDNGTRDANMDSQSDRVLIGILPFQTLVEGIKDTPFYANASLDGFGTRLSYAVSELMADKSKTVISPASTHHGSINIVDENGISVVEPEKSAHFALVSHGDNKVGGFNAEGKRGVPCLINGVTGEAAEVDVGINIGMMAPEKENCDNNDAIFSKSIRSLVDNTDYNDDSTVFQGAGMKSLWARSLASAEQHIYNTNIGNVGVGVDNPDKKFHVGGDMKVGSSFGAVRYCPPGTDTSNPSKVTKECLDPERIAGPGMKCPAGKVATGISNGQLECTGFIIEKHAAFLCPEGKFVNAVSNKAADTDNDGIADVGVRCCDTSGACCGGSTGVPCTGAPPVIP